MGYWAARFFEQHGAKIVGVIERDAAVIKKNGLDVQSLFDFKKSTGGFVGYNNQHTDSQVITDNPAQALEFDCDILIPAALERQITTTNVSRIRAKLIGEGANGPITPGAHEYLVKNNVVIIPDMLLNAGGVTVSYFEWLKNLSHVRFGRMNKRWDERGRKSLLSLVEQTGKGPLYR